MNITHTVRWDIAHRGNLYAGNYRNRKRENASGYIGANPDTKQYLQLSNIFYSYLSYSNHLKDMQDKLGIDPRHTFIGSENIDAIVGSSGDDILYGGTGNDILRGGAGNDTYLFNRGDGQDTLRGDYQ
ncbi:hypothetical protein OEP72_004172, partial [Salmonella enterica]|nr:hypothetical protein [Salmonella enterica]